MSVHKVYNNIDNNAYSGYHGTLVDYIYISQMFINLFKVTEFKIFNLDCSDHYPLFFKFKLKEDYLIKDLKLNYTLQEQNCLFSMNNYTANFLEIRKIIIDLKRFMKKYKYEEVCYIPEGCYLAHGTSSINFDKSNIPYEINNHSYSPKSFTFLNNPGESIMSWYGINDEISLKRLVIYKVKRKIPILNLIKNETTMQNRLNKRFKFYQELFNFYHELYPNYLKSLEEINPQLGDKNFRIMFFLQLLLNNTLFNHINEENNLYNKELFYGTIISDVILNDTALKKTNKNHQKIIDYWHNVEMYEGMEVQLFATEFFLELHSIYYNNRFFTLEEWKSEYKTYIDIIKKNELIYQPINFREPKQQPSNIQEYNITINSITTYQKFITNLVTTKSFYFELDNNNYINMFANIININNWLNINKNDLIFNNLVNDFILNLLNLIPSLDNFNTILDNEKTDRLINFDNLGILENKFYYLNTLTLYKDYILNLFNQPITNNLVKFFYLIILISLNIFKTSKTITEPLLIIFDYITKNIDNIIVEFNIIDDNFISDIKSKSNVFNKKYLKYVKNDKPNTNDIYFKKYINYKQKYLKLKN